MNTTTYKRKVNKILALKVVEGTYMIHEIHLQSKRRDEMLDITAQVEEILVQGNVQDGLIVVYSSHTTAGITINENSDPSVLQISQCKES